MTYKEKLYPKREPSSGFKYMKGQGVMSSTDGFYSCEKVEKMFWIKVYSYLKDDAFTAVKRDAKF